MSQGGAPCFDEDGYNSDHKLKDKKNEDGTDAIQYSDLQGSQYSTECPKVMNNRTPFTVDPFWKPYNNFPLKVTEYDL